jgi:hypothetical protein
MQQHLKTKNNIQGVKAFPLDGYVDKRIYPNAHYDKLDWNIIDKITVPRS